MIRGIVMRLHSIFPSLSSAVRFEREKFLQFDARTKPEYQYMEKIRRVCHSFSTQRLSLTCPKLAQKENLLAE